MAENRESAHDSALGEEDVEEAGLLQLLLGAQVGGVATCLLAAVGRPEQER